MGVAIFGIDIWVNPIAFLALPYLLVVERNMKDPNPIMIGEGNCLGGGEDR